MKEYTKIIALYTALMLLVPIGGYFGTKSIFNIHV